MDWLSHSLLPPSSLVFKKTLWLRFLSFTRHSGSSLTHPSFLFWKVLNLCESWETSIRNISEPFTCICHSLFPCVCVCRLTFSLYINIHFFPLHYLKIKLQLSWPFVFPFQHVSTKKDIFLQLSYCHQIYNIIILFNVVYIQISLIVPIKSCVYVCICVCIYLKSLIQTNQLSLSAFNCYISLISFSLECLPYLFSWFFFWLVVL